MGTRSGGAACKLKVPPLRSLALRFGRDDRFWEVERNEAPGVVNREKLQELRYREGTVGDIKRAGVSHFWGPG